MTDWAAEIAPSRPPPVALESGDRPRPVSAPSASLAFGWRAVLKIKHVPEQLFDAVGQPILFTLMFTYIFGGALAGSTGAYVQFVLPGILVYTVLMMTMYTGYTLSLDLSKGVADRFRSLPVWRPAVVVGALLGDAVRYTLASTIVLALGLLLGFRPEGGVFGTLLAALLVLAFSFSLSWVWTALGLALRTPVTVLWVSTLVLFVLTFVSNIFVDPKTMPGWLGTAVTLNPVSSLVNAARGLMAGALPLGDIGKLLLGCAVLVAVFAPLTMALYRNRR